MSVTPVPIGGTDTITGDAVEVRSPYDGHLIGAVPLCGPEQVDAACAAAAASLALDDFPQYQRAAVLERAASMLCERVDAFAETVAMANRPWTSPTTATSGARRRVHQRPHQDRACGPPSGLRRRPDQRGADLPRRPAVLRRRA